MRQLLATNKGGRGLAIPGAKDCQGQLQTPQSASVVVTLQSNVTDIATWFQGGTSPMLGLRMQPMYLFYFRLELHITGMRKKALTP